MRSKMGQYLRDNYKTAKERADWLKEQPQKTLSRASTSDTLLKLPHPSQTEEYKRRYDILANGTPEQKRELLFGELRRLKGKYTRDGLAQMTDEQIVENFEELELLQGYVNGARNLTKDLTLHLSAEETDELLDFETEFDAVSLVFNRAKLIAEPSYSLVRAESLPAFNLGEIDCKALTGSDKKANALESLLKETLGVRNYGTPFLESELMRHMGTEYRPEQISWFNSANEPLDPVYDNVGKIYTPPLNGLLDGKALTGVLPDGTKKTVHMERLPGGGIKMVDGAPQKKKDPFAGMNMADAINALRKQMDDCDPWYVISSNEFSAVKGTLRVIEHYAKQDVPNNDTAKIRDGLEFLQECSLAYLKNKENKTSYSKREQARRHVMESICAFATRQLPLLQYDELGLHGMYEKDPVFGNAQAAGAKKPADLDEDLQDIVGNLNDVRFDVDTATPEQYEEKVQQYEKMDCKPLEENDHALQMMQKDAIEAAKALAAGAQSAMLTQNSEQFWKMRMAQLTLFHLVLTERGSGKFNGKPGPIERQLAEKRDELAESICSSPEFANRFDHITPERIGHFLLTDEARNICKDIIARSAQMAKQPDEPAPEKNVQKNMEAPMQKL